MCGMRMYGFACKAGANGREGEVSISRGAPLASWYLHIKQAPAAQPQGPSGQYMDDRECYNHAVAGQERACCPHDTTGPRLNKRAPAPHYRGTGAHLLQHII